MSRVQRRALVGLCFALVATTLVSASMTFTLAPMMRSLGLTSGQGDMVMAMPAIASMVVVFVAGRLGDRLGHRRVTVWSAPVFVVGALLVASASDFRTVQAGMLLLGASVTATQVACFGLLQGCFPDGRARVSGFSTLNMMFPAVFMVVPVLTGRVVAVADWRVVPAAWMVAGLLIPAAGLMLLPAPGPRQRTGELATPLLAGLALAGLLSATNRRAIGGWNSHATAIMLVVAVIAAVALIVLLRRLHAPTFSMDVVREPGMGALLVALLLVACAGTLGYVTLAVQYLHSLTALQAAVALLPAQVGAVLGAKALAGRLMNIVGTVRAGAVLIAALAISYLTLLLVTSGSPIWVPVLSATSFIACAMAALTVLNAAVMGRATEREQGTVSSFRAAAGNGGNALQVLFLGRGVIAAVNASTSGTVDMTGLVRGLHVDAVVGATLACVALTAYVLGMRQR